LALDGMVLENGVIEMSEHEEAAALPVNPAYSNQISLGATILAEIADFGNITRRQLIEDVRQQRLPSSNELEAWLEDSYRITPQQLDDRISREVADRWYIGIGHWVDFYTGAGALAYDFARKVAPFRTDEDGQESANGEHLWRTSANGPRKFLGVEDEAAARWLVHACRELGIAIKIEFV